MRWLNWEIRVKRPFALGEVEVRLARRFHVCRDGGIIERRLPYVIFRTDAFRTGLKFCLHHAVERGLVVLERLGDGSKKETADEAGIHRTL
jgi:hypothetical protein